MHHWEQRQVFEVTCISPLILFELITHVNDTLILWYPQRDCLKLNTIVLP